MRVSPTDPALHLLDPDDVARGALPGPVREYRARAREVVDWARAYLCRPHSLLGREGPVCPYTEPSLERALFWLAIHPGADPTPEQVAAAAARYRDWFLELEPTAEKEAQYKAILILFPDLPPVRPLRSPVPLLVIRHMVRTDARFLTRDAATLAGYLARFGDAVPPRLEPVVREAARAHGLEDPPA